MKQDIQITGDMDLGYKSPLEQPKTVKINEKQLRQMIREGLKELTNQTIGSYMRAAQDKRRDRQYSSGKWHAIETTNKKYMFSVTLDHGEEVLFSLGMDGNEFCIVVDVDEHMNKEPYTWRLMPSNPRRLLDGTPITESLVGYVIDNLRAGERMKLKGLCQAAKELNQGLNREQQQIAESVKEKAVSKSQQRFMGMVDAYKKGDMPDASPAIKKAAKGMTKKQVKDFAKTKHKGLPEHVNLDESKIRTIVRNTLSRLYEGIELPSDEVPNEDVYTMEDWRRDGTLKVKEGQLISPDVFFQLLESVPPASTGRIFQPGEAYDHDWKTGQALYQTFKNEGNNYYRYLGLQPSARYSKTEHNQPIYRAMNENINELSNDTIDSAYMKAMKDSNILPYGSPERVRRTAQVQNIKQLRNDKLGFDPVDMAMKMRQQGTSGNPSVDRKWATWQKNHDDRIAGRRTYDAATGRWTTKQFEEKINESVQTALVNALGKYTQGKISSKEANKAIMDLANASNDKKVNEGDGNSPYYGEKHDLENPKIENQGNMKWGKFEK